MSHSCLERAREGLRGQGASVGNGIGSWVGEGRPSFLRAVAPSPYPECGRGGVPGRSADPNGTDRGRAAILPSRKREKREIVDTLRTLIVVLTPCPPKIGLFLLHGGRRTKADKSCRRPTVLCCFCLVGRHCWSAGPVMLTLGLGLRVRKESAAFAADVLPALGHRGLPAPMPGRLAARASSSGALCALSTLLGPDGDGMAAGPPGTVRSMRLPRRMYPLGKGGPG